MTSNTWRSANIGPDRIDINPSDQNYRLSLDDGPAYYFIGVMPYLSGLNSMMVSLTLIEASKVLR
jgi:hypothetical protein